MSKTVTLVGVTGLIGSYVYELLKADPAISTIRLLVRRPIEKDDERTEIKLADFSDIESLGLAVDGSDVVLCCIGTTQKKVKGDKAAYRKIDYDIPLRLARACKLSGCEKFGLISAIGANATSSNFYLRLKGEVEDAIREVQLRSVHIFRPSMLMGKRNEFRLGERIGQGVMGALSFLVPAKYKPIHARDVASAMVATVNDNKPGYFIYEYTAMQSLARQQ